LIDPSVGQLHGELYHHLPALPPHPPYPAAILAMPKDVKESYVPSAGLHAFLFPQGMRVHVQQREMLVHSFKWFGREGGGGT